MSKQTSQNEIPPELSPAMQPAVSKEIIQEPLKQDDISDEFIDEPPFDDLPVSRKKRAVRTAGKILIGVIVLLIIAVGGGLAYVWYTGQGPAPTSAVESAATVVPLNRSPVQPAANAVVGASVMTISSPITPGMTSSMSVKTLSGAVCKISAEYNKVKSQHPGLIPKTADEYGLVSWQWELAPSTPLGDWPVEVVCERGGKTAMVRGTQTVVRTLD